MKLKIKIEFKMRCCRREEYKEKNVDNKEIYHRIQ